MKRLHLLLSLLIVSALLPACFALVREATAQSRSMRSTSIEQGPDRSYTLGPSDHIHLRVYGESDITGDYEIDASGSISVPLAGRIKAAGLTTHQLEQAITSALSKGLVRDPRVNVEIITYRPFYILGEVKNAGEYAYKSGLTVLDAVASAGGFTYRANENKAIIRRAGSGAEEVYPLDAPVPVYPGDNIRIPERYF